MDLVPEEDYGNLVVDEKLTLGKNVSGQPDFVHFTADGHRIVAQQLMLDVGGQLLKWSHEKESISR